MLNFIWRTSLAVWSFIVFALFTENRVHNKSWRLLLRAKARVLYWRYRFSFRGSFPKTIVLTVSSNLRNFRTGADYVSESVTMPDCIRKADSWSANKPLRFRLLQTLFFSWWVGISSISVCQHGEYLQKHSQKYAATVRLPSCPTTSSQWGQYLSKTWTLILTPNSIHVSVCTAVV